MNKNIILLAAGKPILNPDKTRLFEKLNLHYSIFLNSLLYSNWIEIISSLKDNNEVYFCIDKNDKDFIPRNFLPGSGSLLLLDTSSQKKLSDSFRFFQLGGRTKFLLIFFNSIGIGGEDLYRALDLLSVDDQSIVIGKSGNEQLAFLASNKVSEELFIGAFSDPDNYQKFLNKISREDIFLHIINNFLTVNNFEDIKKLYIELSKKESLAYCSENMHERFNDLFIEYKDLLNE